MRILSLSRFAIAAVAAGLLASSAGPFNASAQIGGRIPPPGEGVLCAWAIYTAIAEIGRKCHAGEHPEFQAELDDIIARTDAYVLANSTPPVTQAFVDKFKREQGQKDVPGADLCANGDGEDLYQVLLKAGAAEIRKSTDELLARPGNPQWGTCL
jgi:hypothetical protein